MVHVLSGAPHGGAASLADETPTKGLEARVGPAARRRVLRCGVAAAVFVLLDLRTNAAHAGPASKADFHYQDQPRDGRRCSECTAFVPPQAGTSEPACKIVSGPISPNGWCMAFSAK